MSGRTSRCCASRMCLSCSWSYWCFCYPRPNLVVDSRSWLFDGRMTCCENHKSFPVYGSMFVKLKLVGSQGTFFWVKRRRYRIYIETFEVFEQLISPRSLLNSSVGKSSRFSLSGYSILLSPSTSFVARIWTFSSIFGYVFTWVRRSDCLGVFQMRSNNCGIHLFERLTV